MKNIFTRFPTRLLKASKKNAVQKLLMKGVDVEEPYDYLGLFTKVLRLDRNKETMSDNHYNTKSSFIDGIRYRTYTSAMHLAIR